MGSYIVAEIGQNHNGDLALAKQMIDAAIWAGASAVKFQKRDVEAAVPKDQWDKKRDTPWGELRYIDYRRKLEFSVDQFAEIDAYCRGRIQWFASVWDVCSLYDMKKFDLPWYKVPSAKITDLGLLSLMRGLPVIMSTGGSTLIQIDAAVETLPPYILCHTNSTYPCPNRDLNLRCITTLKERYACPTGYSGHEVGLATTLAAVALGVCYVERHFTMDRSLFGTDQAASVEPQGFRRLVDDIRAIEEALGDGVKRVTDAEAKVMEKLRGYERSPVRHQAHGG